LVVEFGASGAQVIGLSKNIKSAFLSATVPGCGAIIAQPKIIEVGVVAVNFQLKAFFKE